MSDSGLVQLVERLGGLLRARARRHGVALGLQPVHLQVLDYLARCNRFSNTLAALAAWLQATRGTVSQSLTLLEQRGLLSRTPDAEDRRVLRLALTAQGRRVCEQLTAGAAVQAAVDGLPVADVAVAQGVLEQCLRALQRDSEFNGFGQCRGCRYLRRPDGAGFACGLTGEALAVEETDQLCHEFVWPLDSGVAGV